MVKCMVCGNECVEDVIGDISLGLYCEKCDEARTRKGSIYRGEY